MTFNPWQIIVSTFLAVATILGVAIFLTAKGWMPQSVIVGAISSVVVAGGLLVVRKFEKVADAAKTELKVERARSEIPPALQDAMIVAYRPKMPTLPDLGVLPPGIPATPPPTSADAPTPPAITNVSIEVKS